MPKISTDTQVKKTFFSCAGISWCNIWSAVHSRGLRQIRQQESQTELHQKKIESTIYKL
jgi:hypothetical protein